MGRPANPGGSPAEQAEHQHHSSEEQGSLGAPRRHSALGRPTPLHFLIFSISLIYRLVITLVFFHRSTSSFPFSSYFLLVLLSLNFFFSYFLSICFLLYFLLYNN